MPVVSPSRYGAGTGFRSSVATSSSLELPYYRSSGGYASSLRTSYTTEYRSKYLDSEARRERKSSLATEYTRTRAPSVDTDVPISSRYISRSERSESRGRELSTSRSESGRALSSSTVSGPSTRRAASSSSSAADLYSKYSPAHYVPLSQRISSLELSRGDGELGRSRSISGDVGRPPSYDSRASRKHRTSNASTTPTIAERPARPPRRTDTNGNNLNNTNVAEIRKRFDPKMTVTKLPAFTNKTSKSASSNSNKSPSTYSTSSDKTAYSSKTDKTVYSKSPSSDKTAYTTKLLDKSPLLTKLTDKIDYLSEKGSYITKLSHNASDLTEKSPFISKNDHLNSLASKLRTEIVPVHLPSEKRLNGLANRWESSSSRSSSHNDLSMSKTNSEPVSLAKTMIDKPEMSASLTGRLPLASVKSQLGPNNPIGKILEKSTVIQVENGYKKAESPIENGYVKVKPIENGYSKSLLENGLKQVRVTENGYKTDQNCYKKGEDSGYKKDEIGFRKLDHLIENGYSSDARASSSEASTPVSKGKDSIKADIEKQAKNTKHTSNFASYIQISQPIVSGLTAKPKPIDVDTSKVKTTLNDDAKDLKFIDSEVDDKTLVLDEGDSPSAYGGFENKTFEHENFLLKRAEGASKGEGREAPAEEGERRMDTSTESDLTEDSSPDAKDYELGGARGSSLRARESVTSSTSPSPSHSSGLNGLRNIGNTCFMNSVVQCLSNTRPLLEYVVEDEHTRDINTTLSCMKGALINAFATVIKELWRAGERDSVVNTTALKAQVQRFAPRFMGYSQQDAQEFLRYLLEGLHEDVNRVTVKPKPIHTEIDDSLSDAAKAAEAWQRYLRLEDSRVGDIFVGQLKSTLRCTHCRHDSVTFDPFWDLSLPIPGRTGSVKLQQCLSLFTKEEELDGDEKPTCSKCGVRRKCLKWFTVQKFPRVLVIHLKRFSPLERFRGKLSMVVEAPLTGLDMSPYAAERPHEAVYNLYAVSNHSGTTYSGHYTAYCKHPYTGDWHEYNDSRVSSISPRSVVSSEAYVLFYELASSHNSHL